MDGDQSWLNLPLSVNKKPIVVEMAGELSSDEPLYTDQHGKLKLVLDVKESGDVILLNSHLVKLLRDFLDNESLPEYKPSVKGFLYNDRAYLTWPTYRKQYEPIGFGADGDINVNDEAKMSALSDFLKENRQRISVEAELYCWARRDAEKGELYVGITPRLRKICK